MKEKRFAVWDDFLTEDTKEAWERPPIWRYQIVQRAMINKNQIIPHRIEDQYITHFRKIMNALREKNKREHIDRLLFTNNPAYTAWRYWNMSNPGDVRWLIEAYILAGATDEQLLKKLPSKAGVATFEYFRKLFFDIEPYGDDDSLILNSIINVAYDRTCPVMQERDLFCKLAARRYNNLEDFAAYMNKNFKGLSVPLEQKLKEIQEDSFVKAFAVTSSKHSEIDERSIMTLNLAASAKLISHDNAHKIAAFAFQEKVGMLIHYLSIKLMKSKSTRDCETLNKADKKHSVKVLADAKEQEMTMRKRYLDMRVLVTSKPLKKDIYE